MSQFVNKAPLEQLRKLLQSYIDDIDTALAAVEENNYKSAVSAIHKMRSNLFSKNSLLTYKNRINLYVQLSVALEMLAAYHHEYITGGASTDELTKILAQRNVMLDNSIDDILKLADAAPETLQLLSKQSDKNESGIDNLIEELELDDSTIALLESLDKQSEDDNDITF